MAVELNFYTYTSTDGKVLSFKESTGAYNAVTNTGGWGAPNETLGDALTATVTVTLPGEDDAETPIDVSASFPDDDASETYAFTMADFGGTSDDEFEDGVYTVTYTVTTATSTYTISRYIFIYTQVKCCVTNMFADLDVVNCSSTDTEAVDTALEAWANYIALKHAAVTGQIEKAERLLTYVNKLCNDYGNCNDCS